MWHATIVCEIIRSNALLLFDKKTSRSQVGEQIAAGVCGGVGLIGKYGHYTDTACICRSLNSSASIYIICNIYICADYTESMI